MKVRAQLAMVLNLDKCIGCHACSVTCKNVWTQRSGLEYAWFNNVETKPGIGFPKNWEVQDRYKGGWELSGQNLKLKSGSKLNILLNIFSNPNLPTIEDYSEPFTFDYSYLKNSEEENFPTLKPVSTITHKEIDIKWGANWEDDLGTTFESRSKDYNFKNIDPSLYSSFENTFMMYLPRLCEHCLNPACVASCPSGAIYKRDEDGIVLIDQNKCRGFRMCVSACPYKKIYYNYKSGKSEKCILCFPRLEVGKPTICSESCVGRIRYIGILLYDRDRIKEVATSDEKDLYESQLSIILDPNDKEVISKAVEDGVPENFLNAAKISPVYRMIKEFKIAFPLHPEFRTLPMVYYIPPLSSIKSEIASELDEDVLPDVSKLRIPAKFLANLLTAGDEKPIVDSLNKLMAVRKYNRNKILYKDESVEILEKSGLTIDQAKYLYRLLAIANQSDRFVIPTAHKERYEDDYVKKGTIGFPKNDFGG